MVVVARKGSSARGSHREPQGAKARHVAVTIAIVDSGGTLVLEHRMDGASLVSAETAPAKAKSAVMWQRPTSSWIDALGTSPAPLSLPRVIASKGSELLVLDGHIVGAVGVGGSVQNEGDIAKKAAGSIGKARRTGLTRDLQDLPPGCGEHIGCQPLEHAASMQEQTRARLLSIL